MSGKGMGLGKNGSREKTTKERRNRDVVWAPWSTVRTRRPFLVPVLDLLTCADAMTTPAGSGMTSFPPHVVLYSATANFSVDKVNDAQSITLTAYRCLQSVQ